MSESGVEEMIRVVLADAHRAARLALRALLDAEEGLHVVAEAREVSGLLRRVLVLAPHVLVLDLALPDGGGLHAIRELRRLAPATAIVAMSAHGSPGFERAALHAGAAAFVRKEHADAELPAAVRQAHRAVSSSPPEAAGESAPVPPG